MNNHSTAAILETRLDRTAWKLSLIFLCTALLSACGGNLREVYGERPQVSIDGLERQEDGVVVELAVRNVNDEALVLERISITVGLDGRSFASGDRELALSVSARGREIVRLALPADGAGLERLEALSTGKVQRLPWSLEVRLGLADIRDRRTRSEGWLYRVPGQPNRFR